MISKYFKTKKYLNAFISKKFDTAESLSVPNSKLTIYPSMSWDNTNLCLLLWHNYY